ncbi:hypothetical protein [Uliginosibacterium sediminicola]|uniref:Uncharacterized protein n=1 Tax=Uliginosibacterium sediminicola TaxID=2024550 RepID=A0ABU9YUS4_9RHOO
MRIHLLCFGLCMAMSYALPAAAHDQADIPRSESLDHIVSTALLPQLDHFFAQLLQDQKALQIDGTAAFNGKDKFLPGKIAIGMSYLLLNTPRNDPHFASYLAGYRQIADMTVDEDNESWGIYYYLSALNKLREAGLLEQALSPATLARLREKLDWRGFVKQPEFTLIKLPTNYYGVAFSIARLRYLLGWEDASASEVLLERMVKHYQTYSGQFGFSDETDGDGRFDRYSILLIGEICQRFIETGLPVTPQLKTWLRHAVDVILVRLNPRGDGFEFGRSIGAYGDTAFLEVLSAAAKLDVLTPTERDMAYAFAIRASNKYAQFWFDRATHSVNLWDKGRRTDAYRAKHRILGENLSLLHQHIYTNNLWNQLGYRGQSASAQFAAWLTQLPRYTLTWFARGEYDRALLTVRDGQRVISLPLVNGGATQHMNTPYFPIPFSNDLIQGAADAGFPQLTPRFTLADGSQLIGSAFTRHVLTTQEGNALRLQYRQDALNRLGEREPQADPRLRMESEYRFAPGVISRIDTYTPTTELQNLRIDMEFAGFAERAIATENGFRFEGGEAISFEVEGFTQCSADSVADNALYRAPMGQMKTRIRCKLDVLALAAPLSLRWTLRYAPREAD